MAPHAQSKEHAGAATLHVTTVPEELGIPKCIYFNQATKRKKNSPNEKQNLMFKYIFTGQETKKEIRNAKGSLTPVQRGETSTELP